jgi:hypothetical protein
VIEGIEVVDKISMSDHIQKINVID